MQLQPSVAVAGMSCHHKGSHCLYTNGQWFWTHLKFFSVCSCQLHLKFQVLTHQKQTPQRVQYQR
jgi:hypothetical protein